LKIPPTVGLVIPYYLGDDFIEGCLASIQASEYPVKTVYLADNSPEPYTGVNAQGIARLPLPAGIGFGRACNAGLARALADGHDYLVILNQDAVLAPDTISHLVEAMDACTSATAAAPLSYDLSLQHISEKTYHHYVAPITGLATDLERGDLKLSYPVDYTQINGACVIFRATGMVDKPWFDPVFKQYGEDTELFQRLLYEYNTPLLVVPRARIGHQHSNFSAKGERADWIAAQVRTGMLICWLKDPRRSWGGSLLKAFIVALHTQWITVRAGNGHRLPTFWRRDIQLLGQLAEIRRRRESNYLYQFVQDMIKKDTTGQ
jgi:GT2 family glycosyltransferase